MRFKHPIRIAGLVALIAAGVTALTLAGPGSGTAIISPSTNVAAGTSGEWSIVYTAAETHDDGTVRVTIPSGWTAPQDGSNSSPGFVTVTTNEPTGSPSLSIAGQIVTVVVDTLNPGNTITLVYGDDSASASARANAATTVGSYPFQVASDPAGGSVSPLSSSPALTVIPTTPASLDIVPNDTTNVAAGNFVQMSVRVLDTFGNRAPVASNRTVNLFATHGQFFDPSNHSTPITSIVIASGTNAKRVDYRGTIVAGSPHTINAFTASGSPSLGGSEFVSLVPGPLSASQSTIGATSPVVADGTAQSDVVVTSRDAFGNPREGDTVAIDATGTAITAGGGATDAAGEAQGVVADVTAEVVSVSATINGQAVTSGNPSVTFIAGPVHATNSTVTAVSPVVGNGVNTSTITVIARDEYNNPVAGQTVALFVAPSPNATLTQPVGVTGANGQITGSLSSTTIGDRTVTAQIGGSPITDDAVVQFTAGPLASFEWSVDGASTAGAFENVTLRARDAQGNIVTNYTGTVNLSTTTGGSGDGVVQWDAVTPDADGILNNQTEDDATYQFAASDNGVAILRVTDTRAETYQMRVQAGPVSQLSSNIVNSNASADKIVIVSGNSQSATVDTGVASAPTVRVLDQFDNTVSGAQVTFTAVSGGGSVDANTGGGLPNDSTATTAGNGQIDCDLWRMGEIAGLNRLRARIASGSISSVYFTATGTPGAGTVLDIAPNSQSVTQGTSLVVSGTLTDDFGNAKPGERVDIVIKTGTGTLAEDGGDPGTTTKHNEQARWGNTDAAGRITVQYNAPGGAGLNDVLDASTSSIGQNAVVDATYTTVASGGTNLRITFVGPSTQPANQPFQFLVEAVDGNGNVDTGNTSTVTLTPEVGGNLLFSLTTDFGSPITTAQLQSGARTIYGRGTVAGNWDVTVSVSGGGLGPDMEAVTITDTDVIDHYFVSTVPTITAGAAFNVTVEARDVYNNRVLGANNSVLLEAYDPATSTLLVPSANLVSGSVIVAETYTKAEEIRVRASAAGKEGFSDEVIVTAAGAHRIAKVSGDGPGVIAGATRPLIAQVLDAYDNPVAGQTVTFAMLTGGGSPAPPTDISDSNGEASTVFTTGVTVGSNTVKATILDESPVGLERVDYLVTTVPGPVASFQVVPASLTLTAGVSVGLTVTGLDANFNVVTNDDSTPIQLTETGNATFGAATGTLTDGVFNTTVSDNIAETFTITAQRQGGGASGTSALITVAHAGAYAVTKVTLDPINGVPVGESQLLEVLVRDQFNNPVPGAFVTFATTGLINDGSFTDTFGDPSDGITSTETNGHATVTFTASLTVGANAVNATILDGAPAAQERVTFTVNTVAGGIAYYTVMMNLYTATAGQARTVTVTAYDDNDNLVNDDVTFVSLSGSPGNGLAFGTNPVQLTNGVASTTVTANLVQTYQVRAQTQGNGAIFGLSDPVTVTPANPAGTITGTPDRPTITANGTSVSTIQSSVITDLHGNQVPAGTQITVNANLGGIIVSGSPKLVAANGRITFDLRSSTTLGTCVVTMTSVLGTATGTVNVVFAPPPAFTASNLTPEVAAPGENVSFDVDVQNTSTTDATTLTTATTLSFSDGIRTYTANLSAPATIAGPGTQTLTFNATTVNAAFVPTYYDPDITLVGTDEFDSPINTTISTPAQSLLLTSIQIVDIDAPTVVSRGQTPIVTVHIKNNGAQTTQVTDIALVFAPGGGLFDADPITPTNILSGAIVPFNIPVLVDESCPVNTYTIDAVATGNVAGVTVSDNSLAPFALPSWQIVAAADLSYVPGSMTPMSVSQGDSYQFRATIANDGDAVVSLDEDDTYIRFTDGTRIYQANPSQPYAIAGNAQLQILFESAAVAGNFTPGSYQATFNLQGSENGALFQQLANSGADLIAVQTPAVAASGSVLPNQVSKGSMVAFTVQVTNTGQATVLLTPASTEFRFNGGAFTADLDPTSQTSLPLGTTTLTFLPTTVSQAIAEGTYPGQLVLVGTENGNSFSPPPIVTESVDVEDAPNIQIVSTTPSQTPITQDQTKPFKIRMVVRNNGGAAVTFTEASLRFVQAGSDRTGQYVISTPTGFVLGGATLNGGGATDTVTFDVFDNIANTMTAPAMITIQGFLEVEDVNTQQPIFAERELGEFLQVQTPATINVVAVLPSLTTVTQGMTRDFIVRAVVRNMGTSDVNLDLDASTNITFGLGSGWQAAPRNQLGGGGTLLGGGDVDTVLFDVTTTGNSTGDASISTNIAGVEVNSGRTFSGQSSGSASVTVQSPGVINVVSVVASRSTITHGAAVPWTLTVTLENMGESDVDLDLGNAIDVTFQDGTFPPALTRPSVLAGGGTILSGGETDQIVIGVASAGSYSSFGDKTVTVEFDGTEINSNAPETGSNSTIVTVQAVPQLNVVSVTPATVSRESNVGFQVTISNATLNAATATLDRLTTRLRFGSDQFNVNLLAGSPVDIAQGEQITLLFTPAVVLPSIPNANDAVLEFRWTDNGRNGSENEPMAGDITVQNAPALNISSVRASRQNVTVQQTSPAWRITMVLTNNNGAPVQLNLGAATTRLQLNLLGSLANVTPEYTIIQPTALEGSGDLILGNGGTDSLFFDVTQAGTTPGNVIVSGFVGGIDVDSQLPVSDNTGDGGSGSFLLQTPAALSILSMTPQQSTATAGQTAPYTIKMAVRNTGQAAVDLNLTNPATAVTFSSGVWSTNVQPTLVGGDDILGGGETDTVVFNVTVTGSTASLQTISGDVGGTEINRGVPVSDNTASGGTGSITVQTQATIDILSAAPSRGALTSEATTPWDLTVVVQNAGQSAARLTLPTGLLITVQSGTGTIFDPVNFLEEGGVVLAGGATGTLQIHADNSPTFSGFGTRDIGVSLGAVELNSGRVFTANRVDAGSVIAQKDPVLTATLLTMPTLVARNTEAQLQVRVSNSDPDAATVVFDRATTRVRFALGQYSAFLQDISPVTIPGGGFVDLIFESKLVQNSITVGPYDLSVDLAYASNELDESEVKTITGGISVVNPSQFRIVSISASQASATAGQATPWRATMTITNEGSSAIDLDFAAAKTYVRFINPANGLPDPTYTIVQPTALEIGGDARLDIGEQDQLVFTVTRTGDAIGVIVISGRVEGRDQALATVFDDTFDGGRGSIAVEPPASVAVTATHTSQPRVTTGQGTDWTVRAVLANTGGGDVNLNLVDSRVSFAGGGNVIGGILAGGGTILEGGAVDSVLFTVDTTALAPGTPRIDASIVWQDINTSQVDSSLTTSAGFGSILVQTPVSIRVATTTSIAPNPAAVNLGQSFDIRVEVQNQGQADARDVLLSMVTNGGSTVLPISPITEVPGGQTVAFDLGVTAANVPGNETFTGSIVSLTDENSGEAVTPQAPLDNTAAMAIQESAAFAVTNMRPSQSTVTRSQTQPWNVFVRVQNTGGATAVLTPPAPNDLAFAIAGSTQVDYVVQPPTAFASGQSGWNLVGGAIDSLRYTITVTGGTPGLVDVTSTIDGSDRNDPTVTFSDNGATSVNVQLPAGFAIATTLPVGTFNHADADRDTVNTEQPYEIHVTVDNTGEAVDSVLALVTSNLSPAQRSTILPASMIKQQIGVDDNHTFVFHITGPANPVNLETFTAAIQPNVKSHNTGQTVFPQTPIDRLHQVVIQRPANLSINLSSVSGAVSPNQVFQMSAVVTNLGQAGVTGLAEVTFDFPPGFTQEDDVGEPLTRPFTVGTPVTWLMRAPNFQTAADFTASISTTPDDRNTGLAANVSQSPDSFAITVTTGGGLSSPEIQISAPAGARDNIVSDSQTFTVVDSVFATDDTDNVVATLTVPPGFSVVGTSTRSLGNGNNGKLGSATPFTVIAPSIAGVADIYVTFTGVDANNQQPIPSVADTINVTVVSRAALTTTALVTAPPEATDNTVSIGTTFTVSARVDNLGGAAGIASPGTLTIQLPNGYVLDGGEAAAKPFTIATAVTWQVDAPPQPSGPQQINVTISAVPPDENSGQPALVLDGTANIAMVTEGSAVSVRDVSQNRGIDVGPVPAGTDDVRMLGIEIAYNVSDPSVANARIDSISVTILGADGTPMGPSTVAGTVEKLSIDIGGPAPVDVFDPFTNPVVVSFMAGGSERMIAPDATRDAIVSLSLQANPRATELSVGLRSGSVCVRDNASNQRLGVTDEQGQPLDGNITSEPLVVLSGNFEEYVHNYPNPFRAGAQDTRIAYVMDTPGSVSVRIFAIDGSLVYEENIPAGDARTQAGPQETTWDGRNGKGDVVRNGVYVCVLNAGGRSAKFKIAVAK